MIPSAFIAEEVFTEEDGLHNQPLLTTRSPVAVPSSRYCWNCSRQRLAVKIGAGLMQEISDFSNIDWFPVIRLVETS
ncbi:hypothetical protein J6590_027119 [Homalodisca vitripennis]|nr:hypothetical protein J6590_027119 [Homalodisca vitripennis]